MNGYGVAELFSITFVVGSVLLVCSSGQKQQSIAALILPYVLLAFSSIAPYFGERDDWYATLFCLPVLGLIHVIVKMQK